MKLDEEKKLIVNKNLFENSSIRRCNMKLEDKKEQIPSETNKSEVGSKYLTKIPFDSH